MQNTTTTKANPAKAAFTKSLAEARELLACLKDHITHAESDIDPVDWANAGDAANLVEKLKQAAVAAGFMFE